MEYNLKWVLDKKPLVNEIISPVCCPHNVLMLLLAKRIRPDWLPFTRLILWVNAQNQILDRSRWIQGQNNYRYAWEENIAREYSMHWCTLGSSISHVRYYAHISRKLFSSLICSQHTCWDDDRCEFPKLTFKTNKCYLCTYQTYSTYITMIL